MCPLCKDKIERLRAALIKCHTAIGKWDSASESAEGGWADNKEGDDVYYGLHEACETAYYALNYKEEKK
mgnify:CR=1 FL=1